MFFFNIFIQLLGLFYKKKTKCEYLDHNKANYRYLNYDKSMKILIEDKKKPLITVGDAVCRECYDSINKMIKTIEKTENETDNSLVDLNNNTNVCTDTMEIDCERPAFKAAKIKIGSIIESSKF